MSVSGYIEHIDTEQVRGWAWDSTSPGFPLQIEVRIGVVLIAQASADRFREDLRESGIGNGCHEFVIKINDLTRDPVDFGHLVCVAKGPSGIQELPRTAEAMAKAANPAKPSSPTSKGIRFDIQRPIFILGAARSGTTAMAGALRHGAKIAGHGEGHILGLIPKFHSALHEYYEANGEELGRKTTISTVPPLYFREQINGMFRSLMASVYPQERWLDKTPSVTMVEAIPYLLTVWPNAQFIFMMRSGIDNVLSRQRKFATTSFESSCRDWAHVMEQWIKFRKFCGKQAIEIDQWILSGDLKGTARNVSSFLELSEIETREFEKFLTSQHPEQTSSNWNSRSSLSETGWTIEQKNIFTKICSPMMKEYGYSML